MSPGIPLIVLWALFALLNAAAALASRRRGQLVSGVPLIGGLFGVAGFLLTPGLRMWAWAPPLLDCGTLSFFAALPRVARELWQTSRFTLERTLIAHSPVKRVTLRLHLAGVFVIQQHFSRGPGEIGLINHSCTGRWSEAGSLMTLARDGHAMTLRRGADGWHVEQEFTDQSDSEDLALTGWVLTEPQSGIM